MDDSDFVGCNEGMSLSGHYPGVIICDRVGRGTVVIPRERSVGLSGIAD